MVINIIISFVGAGLLGIPHAFLESGWVLGSVTLLITAGLNLYCMLLLPPVKKALIAQNHEHVHTYSDLGRCILGPTGEKIVNLCLGISQAGFATAYIIFIAANLKDMDQFQIPRSITCLLCIPGLAGLVQFRDMKHLAPFSLLANCANACALTAVLFQDYEHYVPHNDTIHKVKWGGTLTVMFTTIYSMEGVALILSLEASAKHPHRFRPLLTTVIACISSFMSIFGSAGYMAFGDATKSPITLNLEGNFSVTIVKLALCLALYLTFPIMMFPIWSMAERLVPTLQVPAKRITFRTSLVVMSALVAFLMPDFGKFLKLVGSSICTLLGFCLPTYFHLQVVPQPPAWQVMLNRSLMVGGAVFGMIGTYQSFAAMMRGELESAER